MKRGWMVLVLAGLLCSMIFAQAGPALSDYIAAHEALAADDFAKAAAALKAFAGKSQGNVKVLAEKAVAAKDIKSLRTAFKPLSEEVAKMEIPAGFAVAFCPMFENGARWVQKGDKIANPYYGKAMSTCGSIEKKGK